MNSSANNGCGHMRTILNAEMLEEIIWPDHVDCGGLGMDADILLKSGRLTVQLPNLVVLDPAQGRPRPRVAAVGSAGMFLHHESSRGAKASQPV